MTRDEMIAAACDYMGELKHLMLLSHWELIFKSDPPDDEEALAMVTPTYGRNQAVVNICMDLHEQKPSTIHHVLIHELCHLVDRASNLVRLGLPSQLGQPAYNVFWTAYTEQVEHTVDHHADILENLIPIDWERMSKITGQEYKKEGSDA